MPGIFVGMFLTFGSSRIRSFFIGQGRDFLSAQFAEIGPGSGSFFANNNGTGPAESVFRKNIFRNGRLAVIPDEFDRTVRFGGGEMNLIGR